MYRLKQIDYNGLFEYSNAIELDVRTLDSYSLEQNYPCLLYTSDAADERSSVDLGGRRIIKKKKKVDIEGDR